MKIIDLLNKIANGEEPKIKYDNHILKYNKNEERFIDKDGLNSLYEIDFSELNDEIEIIEQETKPITKESIEALGYAYGEIIKCFENGWNKSLENKPFKEDKKIEKLKLLQYSDLIDMNEDERIEVDKENRNKINEIIDYLMEKK